MWSLLENKLQGIKDSLFLRKHRKVLEKKTNIQDQGYHEYLDVQISRSYYKRNNPLPERSKELIDKVAETVELDDFDVLCIGCRNLSEISYLKNKGAKSVVGIDLYSETSEIMVMDMHAMTFDDNSFDLIYSSHSLEHAMDTHKAISEFVRVVRNCGYIVIEVPVNYQTGGADLVDFCSLDNLHNCFKYCLLSTLWSQSVGCFVNGAEQITSIRTIMQICKDNNTD